MFYGEYSQVLDSKNRMRIPSKLKEVLGSKYYILDGADNSLMVMGPERFDEMTAVFARVPLSDTEGRKVVSKIMSTVVMPEEDAQGRFVLPAHSLRHARLTKNLVIVGACDYIEIWSEEEYLKRSGYDNSNAETLGEQFMKLKEYGF